MASGLIDSYVAPSAGKPALEEAGRVLDTLMAQKGITEDQVMEEFKRMRKANRNPRG